jgi:hypothetical protein
LRPAAERQIVGQTTRMHVEWSEPSSRFDVTSFTSEIVDGRAAPLTTVYVCPRCGSKLGITRDNCEIRATRRLSNLSADVVAAIDEAARDRGCAGEAFLDWSCRGCALATRAYLRAWAGGRHGDGGADIVAVAEVADV